MTAWEIFFEDKLKLIAKNARDILDIGSGVRFGKGLARYAELFEKNNYKTLDIDPENKPDIVADIHALPVTDQSVDAIICKAVLEHVSDPQKAVEEIYRVLKLGGTVLAYVPFLYAYHGKLNGPDFYRYSKDGIRHLFKKFSQLEIFPVRGFWETWFYFLPFGLRKFFAPTIGRFLDALKKQSGNQASGYNIFAVK